MKKIFFLTLLCLLSIASPIVSVSLTDWPNGGGNGSGGNSSGSGDSGQSK